MNISELIAKLEQKKEMVGDVIVETRNEDGRFEGVDEVELVYGKRGNCRVYLDS